MKIKQKESTNFFKMNSNKKSQNLFLKCKHQNDQTFHEEKKAEKSSKIKHEN